jgi:hypothetical protein
VVPGVAGGCGGTRRGGRGGRQCRGNGDRGYRGGLTPGALTRWLDFSLSLVGAWFGGGRLLCAQRLAEERLGCREGVIGQQKKRLQKQ